MTRGHKALFDGKLWYCQTPEGRCNDPYCPIAHKISQRNSSKEPQKWLNSQNSMNNLSGKLTSSPNKSGLVMSKNESSARNDGVKMNIGSGNYAGRDNIIIGNYASGNDIHVYLCDHSAGSFPSSVNVT